jgi:hypothetical protein
VPSSRPVEIEVTVNTRGVDEGTQRAGDGLKRIGSQGNVVFTQMQRQVDRNRQSLELMGYTVGVQIPRALASFMARLPGVGTALRAAFTVTAVVAMTAAIARVINNLDELKTKAWQASVFFTQFWQFSLPQSILDATGMGSRGAMSAMQTIAQQQSFLKPLLDQVEQFKKQAALAGKEGAAAIRAQLDQQVRQGGDLYRAYQEQLNAALKQYGAEENPLYQQTAALLWTTYQNARKGAEKAANAEILAGRKKLLEEDIKLQHAGAEAHLQGLQLIVQQEKNAAEDIIREHRKWELNPAAALAANQQKAVGDIEKFSQEWRDATQKAISESRGQALEGFAAIESETQQRIGDMRQTFQEKWGTGFIGDPNGPVAKAAMDAWVNADVQTWQAIHAIDQAGQEKKRLLAQQTAEETMQIEQRAAIAVAAPWERANLEIRADYAQRLREIDDQLARHLITEQDAQSRRAAAWLETNGRIADDFRQMRDQLADDMMGVFDDITSGNIGQRILKEFERFVFRMVATWILGMGQMRQAAAGTAQGGGLLGMVLGGVLGMPALAGGGGGTQPGIGSIFLSGGGPLVGGVFGAGGGGGGLAMPYTVGGAPSASPVLAGIVPTGAVSSGTGITAAAGGGMANTLFGSLAEKAMGKIFSHGLSVGGLKVGGAAMGMAGGMLGMLSITDAYKRGSILEGVLGGAAGGAMMGFAIGGPLGAGIGAAAGAIAGLVGGLFGKSKQRREAERIWCGTFLPAIVEVTNQYKAFQLDYAAALDQLSQIQQQAAQAFAPLGSAGADRMQDVGRGIAQSRGEIEALEKIRQQRAGMQFGPPQFAAGGYVGGAAAGGRLANGGMLAVVHPGEYVVNPQATAQNRGTLEAINRGGTAVQAGEKHVHFHFVDGDTFQVWLRNGGVRKIQRALQADATEYSGG